jgi:NADH-quinone oxidoreductase subunit J
MFSHASPITPESRTSLPSKQDGIALGEAAAPSAQNNEGLVQNLGQLLFSKYVLPFEVSSVLFIASMVGAVLLAKREKQVID